MPGIKPGMTGAAYLVIAGQKARSAVLRKNNPAIYAATTSV